MRARLVIATVAALLIASPFAGLPGWSLGLATSVALKALVLTGLNLIFGVVGMLAFGQAAFMAMPGYVAGVLEVAGAPVWLSLALGLVTTVAASRMIAELLVRLPGIFLAVGTLGLGFVVEGLARAFPAWTGGASGLVFAHGRGIGAYAWYAIAVTALLVGLTAYAAYVRGAVWRRLRAIRHDELAAAVLGIDVGREKAIVFTVGSAYAAAGGLLLAYYIGVLVPEDAGVTRSLEQIGTVLLGGAGFLAGPLLGTSVVEWLFVVAGYSARYELLIYGLAFLGVVIYARHGVAGWLVGPWRRLTARPESRAIGQVALPRAGIADAGPRSGPCLAIVGLSKRFEGVQALDSIGFTVEYGEIFALVGPNGAGKTTLFNIVSGLVPPTSGTLRLDSRDLAGVPIHRRAPAIGRSFQVARLVPELTARENVMVRLDQIASELDEGERAATALAQLETFGLGALAERPIRELSVGQHKLIDIARAAVGDPPLVLLDEPAVGLTPEELVHLADMLATLRMRGSAVVVVEHNMEFVAKIAGRGVVLDGGRQIALGPLREILADPRVRDAYFGVLT